MNDEVYGRLRAYLDDELPADDASALAQQLERSTELREALDEVRQLGTDVDDAMTASPHDVDLAQAEREVLRRVSASVQPPRSTSDDAASTNRRTVTVVVSLVAAAAAILLLWMWPPGTETSSGTMAAERRQTIAIADRGVAVAERGASLSWLVDANGTTVVRQTAGAVFYRVEPGEAFAVQTPAGLVTVTGTCFTVELHPVNKKISNLASASAGAVAATAVFLTVHEGSVVLANDHGQLDVHAGDTAQASATRTPSLSDGRPQGTRPEDPKQLTALMAENSAQRIRLRELQRALEVASPEVAPVDPAAEAKSHEMRVQEARDCARSGSCDRGIWTDPTPEELMELAKCSRLLVDTPAFLDGSGEAVQPYPGAVEAAGLSDEDIAEYGRMAEAYYAQTENDLADLATELGVPTELVTRLDAAQLRGVVSSVVDGQTHDDVRRRLSQERAGLQSAPAAPDQSTGERALRYMQGQGDGFERTLASQFGADAAHEIRTAGGGWLNKSSLGDGECDE